MTPEERVEQIIERGRQENATNQQRLLAWEMLNTPYRREHMLDLFRKRLLR